MPCYPYGPEDGSTWIITKNPGSILVIWFPDKKATIAFSPSAEQEHSESSIYVHYRFDKGRTNTRRALWDRYFKYGLLELSNDDFGSMLSQIELSDEVLFRVGDELGFIDLKGSKSAVDEFRKRVRRESG